MKSFALVLLFTFALAPQLICQVSPPDPRLEKAEKLFKEQHWTEARSAYDEARQAESDWHSVNARRAVEGAVACSVKLQLWDDALARSTEFVEKTKGTFEEAVGQRFLAGLFLTFPHQGLKQGGKFLRGQSGQGVFVYSWKKDRKEAVLHYERARDLLLWVIEHPGDDPAGGTPDRRKLLNAELIGVNFDLATALAQQDSNRWGFGPWGICGWWWPSWGEAEEDSEAVEEADYEEPRHYRGWYGQEQETPTGIPLGADGQPQFLATPKEYSADLGAGPKIRFLLDEIQRRDDSPKKEDAAKALFRWAMIARSLYGPETAQAAIRTTYDRFGRPQPQPKDADEPKRKIWELADDEALTLAGGKVRVVTLPPSESPINLLRQVEEKFPESSTRVEAHYARALYLQTRQQFPQAVAEYEKLIAADPGHKRVEDAKFQITRIGQPGVMLGASGVHLPGGETKLSFTYRNAEKIEFKATAFDLVRYVQDKMGQKEENYWEYRHIQHSIFNKDDWKKYLGDAAASWSEAVPREPDNRVAEGSTLAPLTEPGAFVVEATTAGGEQPSRVLVLVTEIAIVQKDALKKGLIIIADARTGQPIADKAVRIYEHWSEYIQTKQKSELHVDSVTLTTNKDGVIEYARKHADHGAQVDAVVAGDRGRMAFSFFQRWSESDPGPYWETGPRYYAVTDRPVYRPGSTVKFRVWMRELRDRQFVEPRAGGDVRVEIYDAKNNEVQTLSLKADEMGAASGEFQLGDEPPLGIWHFAINGYQPDARRCAGALFRVEEYKKPEFEVSVKPAATQARLGEKIKATIAARYYFGAPVAEAKVTYKIFRENYNHVYFGPGEYDWLYGKGYGRYAYRYPWFPWWGRWGCFVCWDGPWPWFGSKIAWQFPWGYYGEDSDGWSRRFESGTRKALRDLVQQGEARLKADGTYEVEIDTARAKQEQGDRDHRYTIEAEVRDASRRTIEGKGSVTVTRQEFYAFVETDGGWYRPGNETFVEVRTLTPDNVPVAAKGEVVVARIRYGGADNREVSEEVVKRWNAETDADGRLSFKQPIPGAGQYRITFKTRDSWQEEVQGNAVFWVSGPKFDGRVYRFNDLEIIADKRTYKVGETAHLLVNVAENNSRVLFSDNVNRGTLLSWRFIDIPSRSLVIDVPIEARHVPNFFVEATLVRNGRVHSEARELFVPPERGLLDVTVKADKEVYRPGDKGKVRVEVKDSAGKPATGEVTLAAYDEAVTYIQDEFGPSPRVFFYGQKHYHHAEVDSSLEHQFNPTGTLHHPQHETYAGGEPEGWRGFWGPEGAGLSLGGVLTFSGGTGISGGVLDVSSGTLTLNGRADRSSAAKSLSSPMSTAMPAAGAAGGSFDTLGSLAKDGRGKWESPSEPGGAPALIEPEIRANFADTALWLPRLVLDKKGTAETEITFPQSLTTWRLHGYAMTRATQVGDAMTKATTTKKLIVRLQSPRFFIERDEVVLSANVNNYLKAAQKVKAELIIPAAQFEFMGPTDKTPRPDAEGNLHLFDQAEVGADGEHRFDWPLKVLKPGLAKITVKALTADESDGMRMAFPVLVHGINKQVAQSGSYRVTQDGARTLKLDLPAEIDPEQTRLEVTLSPSLAGVMIDALPYLVGYPYGCVEQTMSRFYPTVLAANALKKMGTDLEAIGKQRRQMNAGDLRSRFGDSPVFDSEELARMTKAGLQRIYSFQRNDGGWGWWREDDSSPFQTAYVLQGLHAARAADVNVDNGVYDRGLNFLQNSIRKELEKPKDQRQIGDLTTQAYLAYILSLEHRFNDDAKKWLASLYETRGELNNYGRALLALAMHHEKKADEAKTLLRNLLQFVERDDANETAWVRTPQTHWWFWWNNDIETNAWALRAIATLDPKNDLAPRLVKWLLNNRRNGHYWRSTRDTAQVIAAMTDYMAASGEAAPDYALTVAIDGQPAKEVRVTKDNFFTFDNRVLLQGLQIKPGPHEITLTKTGSGALYYSSYLSYFTKEEDVKGAGNEIFVEREYFKLVPKVEQVNLPANAAANTLPANQPVALAATGRTEQRAGFTRVPLKIGDSVASGDQIEVVLKITAKNTYDYLAFEDMKPAGCEPVELRSGGRWAGGLCANLELRDEKVVFFIGLLEQGQHILRYKLRAETPGHFHALPTAGSAMYAPEVRAISDEMRLRVRE